MSQETLSFFVGYFVSKFMEWLKTTPYVTWVNPDSTMLTQALTALLSFGYSAFSLWASGKPFAFDASTFMAVVWPALIAWVSAELNYHFTLKEKPMVIIQTELQHMSGPNVLGKDGLRG